MNGSVHLDANNLGTIIGQSVAVFGDASRTFGALRPIEEATAADLCWIKSGVADPAALLGESAAGGVICDDRTKDILITVRPGTTFFVVADPKAAYASLVRFIHERIRGQVQASIHPTALIDPKARIGAGVTIGAYSVIGACQIGDGTWVGDHVKIFSDVSIGRRCVIREFVTIGGDGFGYTKGPDGRNVHIPHIGTVLIEDDVHLFPFVNVDRGTLGATTLRKGAAVDHYVHVSHNTSTGQNSLLTAGAILGGGSSVGDDCFIGLNAVLREKQKVANRVVVGMSAAVVNDVPDDEVWVGNPARLLKRLRSTQ